MDMDKWTYVAIVSKRNTKILQNLMKGKKVKQTTVKGLKYSEISSQK